MQEARRNRQATVKAIDPNAVGSTSKPCPSCRKLGAIVLQPQKSASTWASPSTSLIVCWISALSRFHGATPALCPQNSKRLGQASSDQASPMKAQNSTSQNPETFRAV